MNAFALTAAFTAGFATSVGPCMAPRYLALAALTAKSSGTARWIRVVLFAAGLLLCYTLLATAASLVTAALALSQQLYWALAVSFVGYGLRQLIVYHHCRHHDAKGASLGAPALCGTALGLVFSPCCTPVVPAIAGAAAASGSFGSSLATVGAFALGHMAPLAAVGIGLTLPERLLPAGQLEDAAATTAGGLMIALGCYYGLLA